MIDRSTALASVPADAPAQPSYNRLRDLIRADIIAGRLPSGARLKVADLALRYASSGIPVREALQQLQGEGIVIITPNRGARVRQIDEQFIRNIHEVRALVEPYLIRWLARHRSEAQLAAMEAALHRYDQAVAENAASLWRSRNREFHNLCYNGHYNDEALVMAARHNDVIGAIAARFPPTRTRALQASAEHWAILQKVRAHDEDGAALIVAEHVRHAGQHMIERIQAAGWEQLQRPAAAAPAAADHSGAHLLEAAGSDI